MTRVTFAVVAYNQEGMVAEAVAAALAQAYQPLYILLSDDCSTDGTFAVMQELAARYHGPHQVTLHRNPTNLGVIGHYNQVLQQAEPGVVIVAPGDDVSLPERTARLMARFEAPDRPLAVHSSVMGMDIQGRDLLVWVPPVVSRGMTLEQMATARALHIGAAAGYRTDLVTRFGPITEPGTYEDLILGFRAALLDGLAYVNEPLVRYRVGSGITTRARSTVLRDRLAWHRQWLARDVATMRQRVRDCAVVGATALAELPRRRGEVAAFAEALFAARWWQLPGLLAANWRLVPAVVRFEAAYLRGPVRYRA